MQGRSGPSFHGADIGPSFPQFNSEAQALQLQRLAKVNAERMSYSGVNPGPQLAVPPLPEPTTSQIMHDPHRKRAFLEMLAKTHASLKRPLPPALCGSIDPRGYDPKKTMWAALEVAEVGSVRVLGREVDLFKLWSLVREGGGYSKMTMMNTWPTITSAFGLPPVATNASGQQQASHELLIKYYRGILQPLDEGLDSRVRPNPAPPTGMPVPVAPPPTSNPFMPPPIQRTASQMETRPEMNQGDINILDDSLGTKRKIDSEEPDLKRARLKMEAGVLGSSSVLPPTTASVTIPVSRELKQASRRKIEYQPFSRPITTYGGRELDAASPRRKATRPVAEWGSIDIESLTMSIRSRVVTELAYGLTTMIQLSQLQGPDPNSGFPVHQCPEMMDELLDLVEDQAFGDAEDTKAAIGEEEIIVTHRRLVEIIHDESDVLFAGLNSRHGGKDHDLGPRPRPAHNILAVVSIVRNLAMTPDNAQTFSGNRRLLEVLLRLCSLASRQKDVEPKPRSPNLSLEDLITIRKDVLYILWPISKHIRLRLDEAPHIPGRLFELVGSFVVDPDDCLSPTLLSDHAGVSTPQGTTRPSPMLDMALHVFTHVGQPDGNREAFSKVLPQSWMWLMFQSLLCRMPVVDADFALMRQEHWASYVEKAVMSIYALAFLAPPEVKLRLKTQRSLGFSRVLTRMIRRSLAVEERGRFSNIARRAVEALKVVDDGEDSFDHDTALTPTLSFGMGYGEDAVSESMGNGILGGFAGVAWEILMARETDDVMFSGIDTISRVAV